MLKKKITQEDRVLKHLQERGSITTLQAIHMYGITRLSAKIFNLKKMGFTITGDTITSKNRYGDKVHYKRYILGDKLSDKDGKDR